MPRLGKGRLRRPINVFSHFVWYYCWLGAMDRRLEGFEHDLFEQLAFITRYTSNDYFSAMAIPARDRAPYFEAVSRLVESENKANQSPTGR